MKPIFIAIVTLFITAASYAQTTFYVAHIDTATGAITIVDSVAGVRSYYPEDMAYNDDDHSILFTGSTSATSDSNEHLYSVNAFTGEISTTAPFNYTTFSDSNFLSDLQYDNKTNTAYAINSTYPGFQTYFVSVNTATGSFSQISHLQLISQATSNAYDSKNGRYIFMGNYLDTIKLFSLNTSNGAILTDPVVIPPVNEGNTIGHLAYDSLADKLYGIDLVYTGTPVGNGLFFCSINMQTGIATLFDSIPGSPTVSGSSIAYNTNAHTYMFIGYDQNKKQNLYSINAVTDSIRIIPLGTSADSVYNMDYLHYDDPAGALVALIERRNTSTFVTGHIPAAYQLSTFPNPTNDRSIIQLDKNYSTVTALVTNSLGQTIRKDIFHSASEINIRRGELPDGLYFVQLTGDGKSIGTVKLGIE
jgi:hypothetical protein